MIFGSDAFGDHSSIGVLQLVGTSPPVPVPVSEIVIVSDSEDSDSVTLLLYCNAQCFPLSAFVRIARIKLN